MASPMAASSPRPLAARPASTIRPQPLAARPPVAIAAGPSVTAAAIAPQLQPAPGSSSSSSSKRSSGSGATLAPRAGPSKLAQTTTASTTTTTRVQAAPTAKAAGIAAAPSSSSTAIKAGSPPAAAADKKNASGSSIQPSKEWVLPARAKPGRKPSETEPPTKRKAQNRASQRAFRERKQMYLADLEAKVAAYEKAEIDRSVEYQKAAKRLKDENDQLKRDHAALKERYAQLEAFVASMRAGGKAVAPLPSRSGPGCKAPAHEARAAPPRKGVLAVAGSSSSSRAAAGGGPRGAVRFADEVDVKPALRLSEAPTAGATALSSRPIGSSASSAPASSRDPAASSSAAAETVPLPISLRRPTAPPVPSAPLWTIKPSAPPTEIVAALPPQDRALLSPPLMGKDHAVPVEGGCGFCTEASPCVCADDFLNLDGSEKDDSPKTDRDLLAHTATTPIASPSKGASTGAAMVAAGSTSSLPLRGRDGTAPPAEQAASMRIDALTNATVTAATPASSGAAGRKRLWYTVPPADEAPIVCPTSTSRAAAPTRGPAPRASKRRLWYTVPASDEQSFNSRTSPASSGTSNEGADHLPPPPPVVEPVCTGDPSSCGACSADPGLAAFCEAVTNSVQGSRTTFTSWDAGNAIPLSSSRGRSNSGAAAPSRLVSGSTAQAQGQQQGQQQRPSLMRYSTTGHLAPTTPAGVRHIAAPSSYRGIASRHQTETITSAWRQIRSHPRFDQWQGGLDLLAEVVSRRSGSVHSPLLADAAAVARGARADSVEIEPVHRTAAGKAVESHDRATRTTLAVPPLSARLLHTASETSIHNPTVGGVQIKRERDLDNDDDRSSRIDGPRFAGAGESAQQRESKRRRILIEREAVQEALALLDRGTAQFPTLTSSLAPPLSVVAIERGGSLSSSSRGRGGAETPQQQQQQQQLLHPATPAPTYHEHDDADGPCPCPWWRPAQAFQDDERR